MRMQVRSSQGRRVPRREEVPGALAIPTVQPDLDLRAEPLVVLDMKSLLSPLAQGLPQRGLGPFRVVRGEAESRHEEGVQIRHHVAVAPFPCLLEDDRPAAAQLGELAPELERPEGKQDHRIEFKGHSGATRAEDVSRPGRSSSAARFHCPLIYAATPCAINDPAPDVGVIEPAARSPRQFARAWRRGAGCARPRSRRGLASKHQGPADPIGLTRPQRQQEASRLEVRRPDRVDDSQTVGRRPADLDPGQVLRGDLAGVARAKMESTQADLDPIQDQGHDGAPRRARKGHPDRFQDRTELRESFVEVARDSGTAWRRARRSSKRLGDRGPGGRGEVFPRRLGAAPGVRQGIREPHPEPALLGVVPRSQLQGQAVQLGGAVEGQGLRRLRRRLPVIHPRALVLPGPMKVDGQDLGIGPARGLQHLREAVGGGPRAPIGGTWATTASRTRSW